MQIKNKSDQFIQFTTIIILQSLQLQIYGKMITTKQIKVKKKNKEKRIQCSGCVHFAGHLAEYKFSIVTWYTQEGKQTIRKLHHNFFFSSPRNHGHFRSGQLEKKPVGIINFWCWIFCKSTIFLQDFFSPFHENFWAELFVGSFVLDKIPSQSFKIPPFLLVISYFPFLAYL